MHTTSPLILSKSQLRQFGFILGGAIILIFGLLIPWFYNLSFKGGVWLIGASFILLGLVAPLWLKPVYLLWERLGLALGWINTRIILGVLFFCIITPLGLFMRALGKGINTPAYRVTKSPRLPKHMEHPF